MITSMRVLLALSLSVALGCTVDKGDDSSDDSTSSGSETSDGQSTGDEPTTGIIEPEGTSSSTGSTGDTIDATTDATTGEVEGNNPCIDTPTVLGGDEASPLGFSGEELLVGKLGPRVTTLAFASEPTTLSDDIKGLILPLTVELRHEGGEIRFIDSEVNPDYDDSGNESGFPGECVDRLEIDVEIDFVTDGGNFDEHRPAVLVAFSVERATARVELLPPGLEGSFDPAAIYDPAEDPPWIVTSIEIGATWDGALAGGTLLNEVHIGEGEDGSVGFGSIAGWGDEIP